MDVYILTEGSKKVGFGHITRCISLYQAFEERKIIPKLLVNGDSNVRIFLKGLNYQIFDWLKEKNETYKLLEKTDIVIIDSYLADLNFYKKISKIVKTPVYIDDNKRLDYPSGIVVNGAIYAEELNYPQEEGITYLLGNKFLPLRKEFWYVPKKVINEKIKNILITFGGIDDYGLSYKIKNKLNDKFNVFIVDPKKKRFTARKMIGLMLKSDICISGGGQTTYELARCGVPTIGICFAKNQIFNLKGGQKEGYLEFAGWYNDKNIFKKIENNLTSLNYKKRVKMSMAGKNCVDGKGTRRIVTEILKIYEYKN